MFGIGLGLAVGLWSLLRSPGMAVVSALFPIPKIALVPLFIIWFGIGEGSKIATLAFGVFFPTVIATAGAVDNVPRSLIRMAQSFGLSRAAIVRKVVLPAALPAILNSFRVTSSIAIVLLVAAEMIGADRGIGAFVLSAGNLYDTDNLLAGIVVLSLLGLAVSWLIGWAERRCWPGDDKEQAMERIDLRSDTVTLPSDAMRAAMASAPVGDDQYGEDPTVRALQERIAALLGKEAALFVPSGTMANQMGLKLLTRPGDDVVVGDEAHIVWHEFGRGGGEFRRAVHRGRARRPVHRGGTPRRVQASRATSSSRRPRWWRWRTRTTAAVAWCSRRPKQRRSAPRRASSAWRRISMARACSIPRLPPDGRWRNSRRRSMSCRWRCRRGWAARSAA